MVLLYFILNTNLKYVLIFYSNYNIEKSKAFLFSIIKWQQSAKVANAIFILSKYSPHLRT